MRRGLLALLLTLAAAPAWAQPRQNVGEYLAAAMAKDPGISPDDRVRLLSALKDRFADYALAVVPKGKTEGVDVVLRMIVEGTFDEASPERIADVSFAAYQAIGRGAPADVVEGIALYGYRKKIAGERLSVWANGYNDAIKAGVPPEIAADLVRNAMESDWEDATFNMLKWALVQAAKERFNVRDYAVYLFGHMLKDGARPGALTATAHGYFKKLARTKAAPELPPYEGTFSRKPVEKALYEARPTVTEPPPATVEPQPQPDPRPEPPVAKPPVAKPPVAEPPVAKPPVVKAPAVKKVPTPRDLGLTMSVLWPGLDEASKSYLGTPYVWGGVTHKGIDCSGFTQNTYGENKVGIPRVSRQQWGVGDSIAFSDLRQGDLVFFNTMGVGVSHVGMVVDPAGPKFMHASSSKGVMVADLSKNYYKTRYLGARRIVP